MNKINAEFESIMDSRLFRHVPGGSNPGFGTRVDRYTSANGKVNIHCLMLIDSLFYRVQITKHSAPGEHLVWSGRDLDRFRAVLDQFLIGVDAGIDSTVFSESGV